MKRQATAARNDAKGITMTELMIAISITSIVFLSAYALMSSGLRQFTEGTNQLESQKNGRRIVSFFRKKFMSAVSGIKTVNIGEKAPTGLSTGIEFNLLEQAPFTAHTGTDGLKTVTETYYLSGDRVMMKDGRGHQPQKIFGGVKTLYFKIFTVERQRRHVPLIMISVTTEAGNQTASYESMVLPAFIGGLRSADGIVLPAINSYAADAMN